MKLSEILQFSLAASHFFPNGRSENFQSDFIEVITGYWRMILFYYGAATYSGLVVIYYWCRD
jgi:hypothetical protein